ncbi:hypothetical protein F5050DRAFT_1716504 [Lentinula boryana]|uniref:Uncharacterized protein n=1 Tax=Lentinula boryana TaxID=40481 RepID=A0ABQ8PX42_9AGAR|nr:hypothetical protein F5050DRAFT_1716504 [Lentinula boryana]
MPIIGAIGMKRLTCYIPIEIPDHVLSNEESLQFSENLDKVEAEMEAAFGELNTAGIQALHNVLQHHLQASNSSSTSTHNSTPPADILSSSSHLPDIDVPSLIEPLSHAAASQSKQNSASAQSFTWQIGKTEQQLFNGTLRKCCLGRGCFRKVGMKSNDNCSYKLCKACCAIYQQEVSGSCKEAGHKPSGKESAATAILQDQQIYANNVKKNVRIKFWDENGQMDMLMVESPTHPYFCIDNCSVPVREVLGVTNGKLVWIFDPKTRSWVLEESCNKRLMYDGEILLIRPHSCTEGVGMQEAEEEETNRQRPQKRKFNDDIQVISAPSTPSRGAACEKASSMKTGSTSCQVPMNPSRLPSPVCTLASIRELSSFPDLPSIIVPTSRSPTPSPAPKVKRAKVAEDEGIIDLTVPSSRHGAWPWKLYKGMHEGFLQLEKKGLKHDNVFPSGSAAKTKASARAAWAAGTSELKAKFYSDPRSTWKAYINAVKELHGGTIPSHSDSRKTKKIPQALNVKHEVIEFDLD